MPVQSHIFTSSTPRPWGVRNTMSAIQRGHHGVFFAPDPMHVPDGFDFPTYESHRVIRGKIIIEEDDNGNKTKRRGRDTVITTQKRAICTSRLVREDGTEILCCTDGWHVFNSSGRRVTQNGSPSPEQACAQGLSVIAAQQKAQEEAHKQPRGRGYGNNRRSGGRRR